MAITVRPLIEDSALGLEVLVDAGVDRPIRWVHVTELADPSQYLQGNELILTNGLWLSMGVTADQFVSALRRADVAALGFGLAKESADPEELMKACARARITLFTVPYELPFIAISQAFVALLTQEQQRGLERVIDLSSQYLHASVREHSLEALLDVLARSRDLEVHVLGPGPHVRSRIAHPLTNLEASTLWREVSRHQEPYPASVGDWAVFPITVPGRPSAFLLVRGRMEGLAVDDRVAVDHCNAFLARELKHQFVVADTLQRFAGELIDLAIAGHGQLDAVIARLRAFGVNPDQPLLMVICQTLQPASDASIIEQHFNNLGVRTIIAVRDQEIVAIVQWTSDLTRLEDVALSLHDDLGAGAILGVGAIASDARELRMSLLMARQACLYARVHRPESGYATYADFGSHGVLLTLQDDDTIRTFREQVLGPIEAYDRGHRSELLATLRAFLRSGCRWRDTAAELHVHVNTLRHRIARIETLTERDLSSMEDRVDFWLALEAGARSALGGRSMSPRGAPSPSAI